jgi:uncharacterized membrane protein YfcA
MNEKLNLLEQALSLDIKGLLALFLIFALAGFVSGLSGFGFSAVGIAVLWFMHPTRAIPLLMALSTVNQLLSINQLKHEMLPASQWWSHGPATYILGGVCGIPFGIWIMANLPAAELTLVTGIVLLLYTLWMAFKPHTISPINTGATQHILVGMLGGVIGGFTAFPGAALVVWAGLKNLTKKEQRAVVQPYILAMQVISLLGMIFLRSGDLTSNPFDETFLLFFLLLIPVVLPMTKLGVLAFKRMSDMNFKNITLGVLAFSGGGLVYKSSSVLLVLVTALPISK